MGLFQEKHPIETEVFFDNWFSTNFFPLPDNFKEKS